MLQLVFKGRALLHLRSAAFDARSGRYKHLFLFFFYVLPRATYLPIDHSVPRSAEVSMTTRPAARQKAKRAQWVSETEASLLLPELRSISVSKPMLVSKRLFLLLVVPAECQ